MAWEVNLAVAARSCWSCCNCTYMRPLLCSAHLQRIAFNLWLKCMKMCLRANCLYNTSRHLLPGTLLIIMNERALVIINQQQSRLHCAAFFAKWLSLFLLHLLLLLQSYWSASAADHLKLIMQTCNYAVVPQLKQPIGAGWDGWSTAGRG